jgi:hypothetical protein
MASGQILLGGSGRNEGNLSNELTGSGFGAQNANCKAGLSTGGFKQANISGDNQNQT